MNSSIATTRLREVDRADLESHFTSLDAEDRRLRFGSNIADEGLRSYVARLDFERDGLFAVHDENLEMIAVVHVAMGGAVAELGLSVLPGWRGKGCGDALLQRAVNFLRNRSVLAVFVHCLTENKAMMHLARKNGMRIVYSGSESDARLELEAPTPFSFVTEWLEDQRALALQSMRWNSRNARTLFVRLNARRQRL